MSDLSYSVEMGHFRDALERVLFMTHLLRQSDYCSETALNFLLLDVEALRTAYKPVAEVIDSLV